jgi:hypothetical protein
MVEFFRRFWWGLVAIGGAILFFLGRRSGKSDSTLARSKALESLVDTPEFWPVHIDKEIEVEEKKLDEVAADIADDSTAELVDWYNERFGVR